MLLLVLLSVKVNIGEAWVLGPSDRWVARGKKNYSLIFFHQRVVKKLGVLADMMGMIIRGGDSQC